MRITEVQARTPELLERLLEVWEASVRRTHLFLPDGEIRAIRAYVPQALAEVPRLVVAEDGAGRPVGFLGVEGSSAAMLFLAPEARGRGLGRALLTYGVERCGVDRLAVNEQNPQARGFYEHMGFRVVRRTERDEQGGPYPLLYMERDRKTHK